MSCKHTNESQLGELQVEPFAGSCLGDKRLHVAIVTSLCNHIVFQLENTRMFRVIRTENQSMTGHELMKAEENIRVLFSVLKG